VGLANDVRLAAMRAADGGGGVGVGERISRLLGDHYSLVLADFHGFLCPVGRRGRALTPNQSRVRVTNSAPMQRAGYVPFVSVRLIDDVAERTWDEIFNKRGVPTGTLEAGTVSRP